ncbi:MAG: thioredoxin domain-containing protein [Oscillatoria sp. PMC 1076.18]|nr:thioredoxin domain-containing protein [Oscillatoria sp. PMC 1076.18]
MGLTQNALPLQAANSSDFQLETQVLDIIRQHPEVIIESIQNYQQRQFWQTKQVQQLFLQELQTNPEKIIGESPTLGANNPNFVLLEFSDFQCPYCAKAHQALQKFIEKHEDEVVLVYKYLPLASIHPQAIPAAKAAWAASQQGKFWQYQDRLFTQQNKLGEDLYFNIAKSLNLNLEKFQQDKSLADSAINNDVKRAKQLKIDGTPFFVMVNLQNPNIAGKIFFGAVKISDLENILEQLKSET